MTTTDLIAQSGEPDAGTADPGAGSEHLDGAARPSSWPLSWSDVRRIAAVGLALFALTTVAGVVLVRYLEGSPLLRADADLNRWFESLRTPTWNTITDWGSSFSDTITIVVLLAVLIPALRMLTKRWDSSVLLTGAVGLETLVFVSAAFLVGRDRPPVEQLDVSPPTASFPSGHTGAAFAFYVGLVIVVFWWTKYRPARVLAVATFGFVPIVVALSRLYRGMHFPTDVLWGALIGITTVSLFAGILSKRQRAAAREEVTI